MRTLKCAGLADGYGGIPCEPADFLSWHRGDRFAIPATANF
jgi:hypothetical protein